MPSLGEDPGDRGGRRKDLCSAQKKIPINPTWHICISFSYAILPKGKLGAERETTLINISSRPIAPWPGAGTGICNMILSFLISSLDLLSSWLSIECLGHKVDLPHSLLSQHEIFASLKWGSRSGEPSLRPWAWVTRAVGKRENHNLRLYCRMKLSQNFNKTDWISLNCHSLFQTTGHLDL